MPSEVSTRRRHGDALIAPRVWTPKTIRNRFRQCPDTEAEQGVYRIVILLLLLAYGSVHWLVAGTSSPVYFLVVSLYLLIGIGMLAWMYLSPTASLVRRALHLVCDRLVITWSLFSYGQWTSPFYILYIWMDIGNGTRYGRPYLYASMFCSAIGFGAVILFNDYWHTLMPLSVGLWVAILLEPLHANLFYKRLRIANDRLHDLATRDTLTGLPNRPFLYERLREAIAAAQRHNRQFAVVFVDIDNFKRVNDTSGHEAGDAALQAAAKVLRDSVRKEDTVARLGGDEFVLLLHDTEGHSLRITENLRDALSVYTPDRLSVSIGIATYPHCGQTAETLVQHADHAMYEAKRSGGNQSRACSDLKRRVG